MKEQVQHKRGNKSQLVKFQLKSDSSIDEVVIEAVNGNSFFT